MRTATSLILAMAAAFGLAAFALSWITHTARLDGFGGLATFALACGLAWRYRP
jgi:hypothetical protein